MDINKVVPGIEQSQGSSKARQSAKSSRARKGCRLDSVSKEIKTWNCLSSSNDTAPPILCWSADNPWLDDDMNSMLFVLKLAALSLEES
ncbi:hypothetical protein CCR75_009679 [Bremia lactucae]|uniref:Uncharacterized protein n=1 Tax=Bremia lactucae TaxID=4779 RepID=A0A976P057_BRELC|nr:hypothetical protein CCR75_009679 [Bremia lactucae]